METVSEVLRKLKAKIYTAKENATGTSPAWKCFRVVQDAAGKATGYVQCNKGQCILKFKSSTTNLLRHVELCNVADSKQINVTAEMKSSITDACVKMCAKDIRPFSVVSGDGFVGLAQELINLGAKHGRVSANNIIPHRSTVTRRAAEVADETRSAVLPEVRAAINDHACAATTDMWTGNFVKNHYTALTVHYVDPSWALVTRVLFICVFPDKPKTGDNIGQEIIERAAQLDIPVEDLLKVTFVTDQGANIQKALKDAGFYRIPCSAHCANTVLRHTFEDKFLQEHCLDVHVLLENTSKVIAYMKRSGLVSKLSHTLNQDIDTRFNSKCIMLQSMHLTYSEVGEVLNRVEKESPANSAPNKKALEHLNNIDIMLIQYIIDFLKPFKEATDDLEADKRVTLHKVLLWVHTLMEHCEHRINDSDFILCLKSRALFYLSDKIKIGMYHKIATFLCPSFCQLRMLKKLEQEEVYKAVKDLSSSLSKETVTTSQTAGPSTISDTEQAKKADRFAKWKTVCPVGDVQAEMHQYVSFASETVGSDENVLDWWSKHWSRFPKLAKVAKKVLCIPATSASSERVFSCAGQVLSARRSQLNPDHVNDLLFLRSNLGDKNDEITEA